MYNFDFEEKVILGDHFSIWKIYTEDELDTVKDFCNTLINIENLPSISEWEMNIKVDCPRYNDLDYYNSGYYVLKKFDDYVLFKVCSPKKRYNI